MRDNNIKVSIICNAYNHGAFIKDALEGFVMQKTDFTFEVLVHDDASTDNTADIIREYEKKYPDIIKPIYQTENQYSKKNGVISKLQYGRALGKYIAFCEGDDYWTDPLKLQKQFDAMESHPEVDMCAHVSSMEVNGKITEKICRKDNNCIIPVEEVIIGGGGFVSTNSLFYRKTIIDNEPEFRKICKIDYSLQILGALRGGMLYLTDDMSVYRYHSSSNAWSVKVERDKTLRVKSFNKIVEMLEVLNKETDYIYKEIIESKINVYLFSIFYCNGNFRRLVGKRFRKEYLKCSIKRRMLIRFGCFFPKIAKFILRRHQGK